MKMELTGISLLCLADTRHARKAVKSGIKSDFQKVIPSIEKKDEDFSIFFFSCFHFQFSNGIIALIVCARMLGIVVVEPVSTLHGCRNRN